MKLGRPVFLAVLMVALEADAGYLVTGATIARVANTSSNVALFALQLTGGSGPCAGLNGSRCR
jgi:hypothetical protein